MKQEIHTFELWDAFERKTECPLCDIKTNTERSYISGLFRDMTIDEEFCRYLKDARFCSKHLEILFNYRDKFGLALVMNRLLSFEIAELEAAQIRKTDTDIPRKPFQAWLERLITLAPPKRYLRSQESICDLCRHIDNRMRDYVTTLIHLWKNNLNFRALYYSSNGFCHKHFYQIIQGAKKELNDKDLDNFLDTSFSIQHESMKRLNEELQWFIKKFNYHYNNEPWGSSKDSLARCISKMK
jgi:hypothetical protein